MAEMFQLTDDEAAGLANLFGLLSDRTRVRLLGALAAGEACVGDLQKQLGLPQPTVSHHLMILRSGQLVVGRRGGKRVLYALGGRVRPAADALQVAVGGLSVRIGRVPAGSRGPDGPDHEEASAAGD